MSSFFLRKNISMVVSDMAGTTLNEAGIIYQSIYNTLYKMGYPVSIEDKQNWHGRDKSEVLEEHIDKYSNVVLNMELYRKANKMLLDDLSTQYFEHNKISLMDDKLSSFFNYLRISNITVALQTGYPTLFQEKIIVMII